jgi:hypothetical protein
MNIAPYIPLIVKAVAGVNVKEEMAARNDISDRPFWMSGRFIGLVMTTVFGSYAAKIGYDLNASIENITELAELIYSNQELLVALGCMAAGIGRGILGLIQAK